MLLDISYLRSCQCVNQLPAENLYPTACGAFVFSGPRLQHVAMLASRYQWLLSWKALEVQALSRFLCNSGGVLQLTA
jgi:hypothetical protein